MNAHGEIAKLPKLPNPNNLKMAPVTFAPGNPAYADAQASALLEARKVLKEADSFLKGDDMHAKLAKCALLTVGAEEMAAFASQGAKQKSYVDLLLNDLCKLTLRSSICCSMTSTSIATGSSRSMRPSMSPSHAMTSSLAPW